MKTIENETDLLEQILSEEEKAGLRSFLENEHAVEAVRKIITSKIENEGVIRKDGQANPTVNFLLEYYWNNKDKANAELGQDFRIKCEAVFLLEQAWKCVEAFKGVTAEEVTEPNKAR